MNFSLDNTFEMKVRTFGKCSCHHTLGGALVEFLAPGFMMFS